MQVHHHTGYSGRMGTLQGNTNSRVSFCQSCHEFFCVLWSILCCRRSLCNWKITIANGRNSLSVDPELRCQSKKQGFFVQNTYARGPISSRYVKEFLVDHILEKQYGIIDGIAVIHCVFNIESFEIVRLLNEIARDYSGIHIAGSAARIAYDLSNVIRAQSGPLTPNNQNLWRLLNNARSEPAFFNRALQNIMTRRDSTLSQETYNYLGHPNPRAAASVRARRQRQPVSRAVPDAQESFSRSDEQSFKAHSRRHPERGRVILPSDSSDNDVDPTAQPYWWRDKRQSGQAVSVPGSLDSLGSVGDRSPAGNVYGGADTYVRREGRELISPGSMTTTYPDSALDVSMDDQSMKDWQDQFPAEFPHKGISRIRGDSNDSDADDQAFHGLITGDNSEVRTGRSQTNVDSELIEPDIESSGEDSGKSYDWEAAYASMETADTRMGNSGILVEGADQPSIHYSPQPSLTDESISEAGACGVDQAKVFSQSPERLEACSLRSDRARANWESFREGFKGDPRLLEEYESLNQEYIDHVDVREQLYMSLPFGEGGFGQVTRVKVDDDRELVYKRALKKEGNTLEHEKRILRKLNHPNIIKISELESERRDLVMKRRKSRDKPGFDLVRVHNVAEYFSSGYFMEFKSQSLEEAIDRGRLTNSEREKIAFGIIDALSYLERNRILHLDIKPGNILLSVDGQPTVCDFGNAKEFGRGEIWLTDTTDGSLRYMPVELAVVRNRKRKKMPYKPIDGAKADAWSLGITLLELYFADDVDDLWNNLFIPFLVAHLDEEGIRLKLPDAKEEYSSALKTMIDKLPDPTRYVVRHLLKINPDERWVISDAMRYLQAQGYTK